MSIVIALDSGTQSSRAIATDAEGTALAVGQVPHPPLDVGEDGAVTQQPADVWQALSSAIRTCMDALGDRQDQVVAAALTTQRFTMIPCGADGAPLMPAIHWLDRRMGGLDGSALLKVLGMVPKMHTIFASSRGRVLRTVAPDVYAATQQFLPLSAWLTLQLCGEAVDTPGSFPGLWPMDAKTGCWHTHDRMARLLEIPLSWLPPLVPAGSALGTISAAAAATTGLPVGTPLVAVGGDKQAELLGSGAVSTDTGVGAISLGTAASVNTLVRRFQQDLSARIYTTAAAEPDAWCLEYMLNRGMWMVTWFMRELQSEGDIETMEAGARAVPVGADGLICVPRWGAPVAAPHERGALVGFSEVHTRSHIYRATIEGICMDLRRGLGLVERRTGQTLSDLRVGGGGSRSDWVVQTLANVLGRPLRRGRTLELSALGAAINAAVFAGLYPDHAGAAAAMTGGGPLATPDPDDQARYDEIYRSTFLPMLRGVGRVCRR